MTAINQDFTVYAGDAAYPQFTVRDGSGTPIDISTAAQIIWNASRDASAAPVLVKTMTTGGISLVGGGTGGIFRVNLSSADTAPLTGFYIFEAEITDFSGNVSTVSLGRMQVGRLPMATYSGDPANSTRDAIRFWLQDTNPESAYMTDPEIDALGSVYSNPIRAAAAGARQIALRYSAKADKAVGDFRISYGQISKNFAAMAAQLQAQGDTMNLRPYSGGISRTDRQLVAQDTDRVRPPFKPDQFDNRSGSFNIGDTDWDDKGGQGPS